MRPRSGRQHLKHQQLGDLIVAGVRQQMAAAGNRRGPESSRAARHRAAGGWVRRHQLSAVARLGHGTAAVTATSRRRRLSGQLEQARAAIGRRPGRAAGRLRHAHRAARTKRGRLPVPGHPLAKTPGTNRASICCIPLRHDIGKIFSQKICYFYLDRQRTRIMNIRRLFKPGAFFPFLIFASVVSARE